MERQPEAVAAVEKESCLDEHGPRQGQSVPLPEPSVGLTLEAVLRGPDEAVRAPEDRFKDRLGVVHGDPGPEEHQERHRPKPLVPIVIQLALLVVVEAGGAKGRER